MPCRPIAAISSVRTCVGAVVLCVMWLLTGCSTPGSAPSATSTTTATPASSASAATPSATPSAPGAYKPADAHGKAQNVPVPVMPESAKENSEAGLEAFIGYWYAQQNYAMESGDQAAWSEMSEPGCRTCRRIEDGIHDSHIDGRWSVGGKISVPAVELLWKEGVPVQQAKVQIVQEKIEYFNEDGSIGRPAEAASNSAFALFATYEPAGWKVTDLGLIK